MPNISLLPAPEINFLTNASNFSKNSSRFFKETGILIPFKTFDYQAQLIKKLTDFKEKLVDENQIPESGRACIFRGIKKLQKV